MLSLIISICESRLQVQKRATHSGQKKLITEEQGMPATMAEPIDSSDSDAPERVDRITGAAATYARPPCSLAQPPSSSPQALQRGRQFED